ncbi:hypothetical protein AB0E69_02170 [Kribbella sp. NPDC026611]|uniref:hypothetical protein n=1 Tax=Kribbella sp. NPDC026611 TaxID=3154911 RepID=UPI0033E2B0F5
MEDEQQVSAELRRLADNEHFDPLDTNELLHRGHRGRRRRMIFTASGAAVAVAAVAVAVSVVPNLASADKTPEVATTTTTRPQNPDFEPVPGVAHGEDSADQRISQNEAERRCALRNPKEKRPLRKQGNYRVGDGAQYDVKIGQRYGECNVPGGDKPKPALVAAAAAEPMPTSVKGQLRNCSVLSWIDLTDWHVVASDRSNILHRSILLAISPSGRKLVDCGLSTQKGMTGEFTSGTQFYSLDKLGPNDPVFFPIPKGSYAEMFVGGGGSLGRCNSHVCTGYNYVGWGRAAAGATEVRLSIGSSKVTKLPVHDGWFAFTWAVYAKYDVKTQPKVVAYDAHGKVVRDFS